MLPADIRLMDEYRGRGGPVLKSVALISVHPKGRLFSKGRTSHGPLLLAKTLRNSPGQLIRHQ
jgi:hypothetical protein